jgi:hypothetical protein
MLTAVVVIALCGFAGGYLAQYATLWADVRSKVARRRDVSYALYFDEVDTLDPPFGTIASDPSSIPFPASRRQRWTWLVKAKAFDLVTCSMCFGYWVAGIAMGWAAGAARLTGQPAPFTWSTAPLIWLAACGLHTAAMGTANRVGLFGGGNVE